MQYKCKAQNKIDSTYLIIKCLRDKESMTYSCAVIDLSSVCYFDAPNYPVPGSKLRK